MSCKCDEPIVPSLPRAIEPGRVHLARQPGIFAEHRRALLATAGAAPALARWSARPEELGVLLLELWAYVLDVSGFYDETIAHEAFLRTARRQASLHRLVALLGYVPKPAVAASAALAVLADGRDPVQLGAGTAFRSAALPDDEPPQVFELDAAATIVPDFNAWPLAQVRPATFAVAPGTTMLLFPRGVAFADGDVILAVQPGGARALVVAAMGTRRERDGAVYATVTFDRAPGIPAGTAVAAVRLLRPTNVLGLWKLPKLGSDPDALDTSGPKTKLVLDGLHRELRAGERVIVSRGTDHRWFTLDAVAETQRTVLTSLTSQLKNTSGVVTGSLVSPDITTAVTVVTLDTSINATARKRDPGDPAWLPGDGPAIIVRAGLVRAARPLLPLRSTLGPGDPLVLDGPVVPPASGELPGRFLLAATAGEGAEVTGVLDPDDRVLEPDAATALQVPVTGPVTAHGNALRATRGETVPHELLGSGDATAQHQRFTLAKQPLTYVAAAETELGARSTLEIRVNGRRWREVPSFYGAAPLAEVFITRAREDGATDVIFGGYGRGAPLPTGAAVAARYRFGAGAAAPPARSITQFAKPVPGLSQVRQPLAAWGGADAEAPEDLRRRAPGSALLLGRVVSLPDVEIAAAGTPGVRAVRAEWRWSATRQRPVVHVAYIGATALRQELERLVRALADPTTPVEAEVAEPEPHLLAIDITVDPALEPAAVAVAVRTAVRDGDGALLEPARLGIGRPLFRSVLFEAVLAVSGVAAVQAITVDGSPWDEAALVPADGSWLDFVDAGDVQVNGTVGP